MIAGISTVSQSLIKIRFMLYITIGLVLISGYPGMTIGSEGDKKTVVKKYDKVRIQCTVSLKDGTVFQKTGPGNPLEFTVGSEQMPRGLDQAVRGMGLNEQKMFTVEPKDAYGKRDEDLVMKFIKADLPEGFEPVAGRTIKLQGIGGTIVKVDEEHVFLDCNHPLAGKDVIFDIKVVGIE